VKIAMARKTGHCIRVVPAGQEKGHMTPLFTMATSPCQQSKKHGCKSSLGEKKEKPMPAVPGKTKALN